MLPAAAQQSTSEGAELAREWCARCHNVEPAGQFKQSPPSFAAIAVYRSAEQIRARLMVAPLHVNMPALGQFLTPENVDQLVSYIQSLETQ